MGTALFVTVTIFLLLGAANTIIGKLLYQTWSNGSNTLANPHAFNKPWFCEWMMFVGMFFWVLPHAGKFLNARFSSKQSTENERKPLVKVISSDLEEGDDDGEGGQKGSFYKSFMLISIPAICDTLASFLSNVGLIWISASIWQMAGGTIILFTAIIRSWYLRVPTRPFEWAGIAFVTLSIGMVGFASLKIPVVGEEEGSDVTASTGGMLKILGMTLVCVSQAIGAMQSVLEEKLLHEVKMDATLIVGIEGIWGILICSLIFMPLAQLLPGVEGGGLHEDTIDSFLMVSDSNKLLVLMMLFTVSILLFNYFGMMITEMIDSTSRNILGSIRTLFIWLFMLFMHYFIDSKSGEMWDNTWSMFELAGFGVLAIGVFIYNRVIVLPFFEYPSDEPAAHHHRVAPYLNRSMCVPHVILPQHWKPVKAHSFAAPRSHLEAAASHHNVAKTMSSFPKKSTI